MGVRRSYESFYRDNSVDTPKHCKPSCGGATSFKKGQTVVLRSGSVPMVVQDVSLSGTVYVVYQDFSGDFVDEKFPQEALISVEEDEEPEIRRFSDFHSGYDDE